MYRKMFCKCPNFEWHKNRNLELSNGFVVFSSSFPGVWNCMATSKKSISPLQKYVGHQELLYTTWEKLGNYCAPVPFG